MTFTLPSAAEAPAFVVPSGTTEVEEAQLLARGELFDGLGRRRIIHPDHVGREKPKLEGYTRVTTFIGALEDTTALQKWRTRLILEGAADANLEEEALMAYQRYLRNEHIAEEQLRVMQNSGEKLTKTRVAEVSERPGKDYRAELDDLAERAFFLAGGRDSADYGTEVHNLIDLWHTGNLTPVSLAAATERWGEEIIADFTAYQEAYTQFEEETGAEILHTEALLVDDKLKVAGRTDLIAKVRLPGDQRARRCVVDFKTGKVDNELRLSQQLALYAGSKLYDPETGVRTSARLRQDVAIVVHIPKGEARAEFHIVDLAPGRVANALCLKVRAARRRNRDILKPLVSAEV